jgi:hypothetical protein
MSKIGVAEMIENRIDDSPPVEKLLHSADVRVPLPAAIAHLTLEEQDALEKRVVRKMDYRLMPILIIMYVHQLLHLAI